MSLSQALRWKLNNDMQVVHGNAEMATFLRCHETDAGRLVRNITDAAASMIEQIEQLCIFLPAHRVQHEIVDLNALLRASMARLDSNLPAAVQLQLNLDHLPTRVLVDGELLKLSLAECSGAVLLQRSMVGNEASITLDFPCSPLAHRTLLTTRIGKTRRRFLLGHANEYTGCQYQ